MERRSANPPKFNLEDVLYEAQAIINRGQERSNYDFYGMSWDLEDPLLSPDFQDTLPAREDTEIEVYLILHGAQMNLGGLVQVLASVEHNVQNKFISKFNQIINLLTVKLEISPTYLQYGPTPIPQILEHADATLQDGVLTINWTHHDPIDQELHEDSFTIDRNGFASHERQTFQANKNMARGRFLGLQSEKFGDTAENIDRLANRFSSLCKALKKAGKKYKRSIITQNIDGYRHT